MPRLRKSEREELLRTQYLESEHPFQLVRGLGEGSVPFGKPKYMTGAEALRLNKEQEQKYLNSKDPKARLWRWLHPEVFTREGERSIQKNKVRSVASINAEIQLPTEE